MPRRRRLISCPETKIAAESRVRKEEKRERRERELKRENSARGIKTSLLALLVASYRRERYTYIGPRRGNKVRVCVPKCHCGGRSCIRVRMYCRRVSPGVTCGALKMADALMNWH